MVRIHPFPPAYNPVDPEKLQPRHFPPSSTPAVVHVPWTDGQSFPKGVREQFVRSAEQFPHRFWIVDNSGSMSICDGTRLVKTQAGQLRRAQCTRWSELQETVRFHAEAAAALRAPTEFIMLNPSSTTPQSVLVGGGNVAPEAMAAAAAAEVKHANELMETSPCGRTPLCRHIKTITARVRSMAETLRSRNQRVAVVIATDGEPTDGSVADALRQMRDLPVWVVVRLCTDKPSIINYWNAIDSEVELDMDVLDDWRAEAGEIVRHNRWINYGMPLHRLREFGTALKIYDLLEEKRLAATEVRDYCALLFGVRTSALPEPDVDWHGFLQVVYELQAGPGLSVHPTADPITGVEAHWVSLPKTLAAFRRGKRGARNPAQRGCLCM